MGGARQQDFQEVRMPGGGPGGGGYMPGGKVRLRQRAAVREKTKH